MRVAIIPARFGSKRIKKKKHKNFLFQANDLLGYKNNKRK